MIGALSSQKVLSGVDLETSHTQTVLISPIFTIFEASFVTIEQISVYPLTTIPRRRKLAYLINVDGGTRAWIDARLPHTTGKATMSLERQVRVAAGTMVAMGCVLGFLLNPAFYLLALFIGAGLIFSGITDTCGMGVVLAKMPWNQ